MSVEEGIVIELLKGFPDNVAAFACHGHLTKAEYEMVVIPDIEERLKRHKKVRLYTEIAPDFVGMDPDAVWPETKFGLSHLFDWERGAMVTDVEWVKQAVKFFSLFGFLMPGERYCQDLWMRLFQATSVSVDSPGSVGVMSMGRSSSLPL